MAYVAMAYVAMAYAVMAYIAIAYTAMVCVAMAFDRYGLHSSGLHRCGLRSYGPCIHGLISSIRLLLTPATPVDMFDMFTGMVPVTLGNFLTPANPSVLFARNHKKTCCVLWLWFARKRLARITKRLGFQSRKSPV